VTVHCRMGFGRWI